MNRLEEWIREKCTEQMRMMKLKDVLTIKNGSDYKNFGKGNVPVYGSGGIITYIDRSIFNKPSVLIPRKGSLDKLYYVDTPFWNVDTIFYTEINTSIVNPKYIYYCLQSKQLEKLNKADGVPSLTQTVLNRITIPVPPLEVQQEIVSILDQFTKLISELTLELSARKTQYTYYIDKLITHKSIQTVKNKKIEEICTISRGRVISKDDIKEHTGQYPVYSSQTEEDGVLGYINTFDYEGEYVTWTTDGAKAGSVFHRLGKFSITNVCGLLQVKTTDVLPRYLFYALSVKAPQYVNKGMGNPKLMSNIMGRITIPVPPLEIQQRIVDVLDNFESICNDLSIGLPAEITSRKAQYEYYRDALLNYAETSIYREEKRREEKRREEKRRDCTIRLIQYVFGSVQIELKTVGKVSMCKRILKSETSDTGDIPFYKIGTFGSNADAYISRETFETYKHKYSFPKKGDVLISASGTVGRTVIYDGADAYYQDSNIVWIDNDEKLVLNQYLFYYYQLQPWSLSKGGTISRLYNDNLSKTRILIPPFEKQKEIVHILDQFDSLCNDISSGLPAEIEKRQQQYETYRNQLFSYLEG